MVTGWLEYEFVDRLVFGRLVEWLVDRLAIEGLLAQVGCGLVGRSGGCARLLGWLVDWLVGSRQCEQGLELVVCSWMVGQLFVLGWSAGWLMRLVGLMVGWSIDGWLACWLDGGVGWLVG